MVQFSSINPWFSIHVDLTIFVWSLNLRSFEQQHQFNRKIKVKQVFLRNLLQFPWSRNIFARHMASRILWRSGFTGSNPILVLLLQKFKKVAQKEGPVCVKYQSLMRLKKGNFLKPPKTTFQSLSRQTHAWTLHILVVKIDYFCKQPSNQPSNQLDLICAHRLQGRFAQQCTNTGTSRGK